MKLYVAGPMRGYESYNFPAFHRAAAILRALGHEVVSPAEEDMQGGGFDPDLSLEDNGFSMTDAMRRDVRAIVQGDGIVLLPGWEKSSGAQTERFVAESTGRKVFRLNPEWIEDPDLPLPGQPDAVEWVIEEAEPWNVGLGKATLPDDAEERVVNSATGGEKGSKLARFDLIPADALAEVAKHFGRGARKYADRNWERGYDWGLSFAALQRHAWAWQGGEDVDEETGSNHLVAVAWHALALLHFALNPEQYAELDNRP